MTRPSRPGDDPTSREPRMWRRARRSRRDARRLRSPRSPSPSPSPSRRTCRVGEDAPGEREPRRLVRTHSSSLPNSLSSVAWLSSWSLEASSTSLGAHVPPARGSDAFAVFAVVAVSANRWYATNVSSRTSATMKSAQWRHRSSRSRNAAAARTRGADSASNVGSLSYRKARDASTARRSTCASSNVSVSLGDAASAQGRAWRSEVGRAREHEAVQGVRLPERRHRQVAEFLLVPSQRLDVRGEAGRGGRGRGGAPRDGIIVGRRASAGVSSACRPRPRHPERDDAPTESSRPVTDECARIDTLSVACSPARPPI